MTVKELIEQLQQVDKDKIVYVEDIEYGNFEVVEVIEKENNVLINSTINRYE